MSKRLGSWTKGNRGMTLAEVALAAAVLGIVVIGLVRASTGAAKSMTQSKLKNQTAAYAKAELEDHVRRSRRAVMDAGKLVPQGYYDILPQPPAVRVYPEVLSEAAPVSNAARLSLRRTVVVTAHRADGTAITTPTPDNPGDYRIVRVTLADTASPNRFSPVILETKVVRPDEMGLDARGVMEAATLSGQVVDDAGKPVVNVRVTLTPDDRTTVTQADGTFVLGRLRAGLTYMMNLSAQDHWPVNQTLTLTKGMNAGKVFTVQGVQMAKVQVTVRHKYPPFDPLEKAYVEIDHPEPLPDENNARNKTWYQMETNPAGQVEFDIPIPAAGGKQYPPPISSSKGYVIRLIQKDGFIEEFTPSGVFEDIPITLDIGNTWAWTQYMYPVNTANVAVRVVDSAGEVIPSARVTALDETGVQELTAEQTTAAALASLTVPLNTIADKTATERKIMLLVQRMGYRSKRTAAFLVKKGETITFDSSIGSQFPPIQLSGHTLTVTPYAAGKPAGNPAALIAIEKDATSEIRHVAVYEGHMEKPLEIRLPDAPVRMAGVDPASVLRQWEWKAVDPVKGTPLSSAGTFTPVSRTDDDKTGFKALSAGPAALTGTVTFTFKAANADYSVVGENFSLTTAANAYVNVVPPLGPPTTPTLTPTLVIVGPSSMPPTSTTLVAANAGNLGGLTVETYAWVVTSGLGALGSPTTQATALSALGPVGSQIELKVTATLSNGAVLMDSHIVSIVGPALSVSLDPSRDKKVMKPLQDYAIKAVPKGGAAPYTIVWLLDGKPASIASLKKGKLAPDNGDKTKYISTQPGIVEVMAKVTDSAGDTATAKVLIKVKDAGFSDGD